MLVKWHWALTITAMLLIGCEARVEPLVPTIPPTPTPTFTPSPSPAPTEMPTSTPTPPPVTGTPTSLLGPTSTPPPATPTIGPTGTVVIEYFAADVESAIPGQVITLNWSVSGAGRAYIYRVDPDGGRRRYWVVNAQGSLAVRVRVTDREFSRFVLVAGEGDDVVERPLNIPLTCPADWFFSPEPGVCPAGPAEITTCAEQIFQHGRMVWVEASDRIYVLYDDGRSPAWEVFPDEYEPGQNVGDEDIVPPPGLFRPVRGFGLIWGTSEEIRDRLGWAVEPEVMFEGAVQSASDPTPTLYMRAADGAILALEPDGLAWVTIRQ